MELDEQELLLNRIFGIPAGCSIYHTKAADSSGHCT